MTETVDACRDAGLRHCHGTWVVHGDGRLECTDRDCVTPAEGHVHAVRCTDVDLRCGCEEAR